MSKRRKKSRRNKGRCPEPLNTMIDLAGAAAMGLYVNHRVRKDFQNGCGEESAKAAATVYGMGAMRRGSSGIINSGGLIGLCNALNSMEEQQAQQNRSSSIGNTTPFVSPIDSPSPGIKQPLETGVWREYCADGSEYGLNPYDFDSADDYESALQAAKEELAHDVAVSTEPDEAIQAKSPYAPNESRKYRWRKYCEDGTRYGIRPEDFETADEYDDALKSAKNGTAP